MTLEYVENPHKNLNYVVRLSSPEFTSICPITGQPDFGHILIDYVPDKSIGLRKSFKLFLFHFRNHGAFHEDCTLMIANKIVDTIKPKWLRISGCWNPRGGIPIDIFFQTKKNQKEYGLKNIRLKLIRGKTINLNKYIHNSWSHINFNFLYIWQIRFKFIPKPYSNILTCWNFKPSISFNNL